MPPRSPASRSWSTPNTATVYPGQVLLEGTNLSEGRGTTRPFEWFGAPWIDGFVLARELNALALPGVVFRETWFAPTFSKFAGQRCGGCQLHGGGEDESRTGGGLAGAGGTEEGKKEGWQKK